MPPIDRRVTNRRGSASALTLALGAALSEERRDASDRRRMPRRRADMRSIEHFVHGTQAGPPRLEVIVDGEEGMRMVAMFACGCVATEPIGRGGSSLEIEACPAHVQPVVVNDRRRRD